MYIHHTPPSKHLYHPIYTPYMHHCRYTPEVMRGARSSAESISLKPYRSERGRYVYTPVILYTLYTPFIHLYSRIYTYVHPLYMYIHHIYTSHTSNYPLNTL